MTYNFQDQTAERTSTDQTLLVVGVLFSLLALYLSVQISNNRGPTTDPDQLRKKIMRMAILHGQLSDIVDQFNSCHSTTVMLALATAFGLTVFSTFATIHVYAANVDDSIFWIAWSRMLFDMLFISIVVYVLICSGLVNDECKLTAVLVHKSIGYRSYDRRIFQQLRKMSQQMRHHTPKISCRLFDFDWELMFTIIGSLSTYLVILMQFDLVNYRME
ncbi:gustatory receptor for bitter taste 66a-like [Ochlerotatus camptorhynchus]|uniref:gustatory receptor for bitter taste 66a-like n=1 Tax=Ochlerotatus camptorhynchus TaxID=644619 RepID=UPI0031D50378